MTESLKYTVIKKENEIELRSYPGYIQAEVEISARDHRAAVERGFNPLADYIFGNNISRRKIEMTVPVTSAPSEKIAMTTPVTVSQGEQHTVAFVMPAEFSLDNLPVPRDGRVRLREVPGGQMAAIRFSGYFNQEKIRSNLQRLRDWLAENGLEAEGNYLIAGYSPPWVPGILARNEILIKVKPQA